MAKGKLEHPNQSFSVEIEVDDETIEKLRLMSDNDEAEIEVTVIRGNASSPDVYVSTGFDNLEVESMSHDVEIISELKASRLVKPGTKIKVKVTTRVDKNSSAIFQ